MWINKKQINNLSNQIDKLNKAFENRNILELIYVLDNKKEIIKRNLLAGLSRGVGIGIGVTLITSILIYMLQKIVMLNIPIIGEYISDSVDIVQKSK